MGAESAETERRLAELERLLAFIEDSGAVGVLQLDSRARIRRVNGAFVRRFGFEPEVTIKAARQKCRIYEVPISYHGRTYEEGKKITWKDGVAALYFLFKYGIFG